MPDFWALSDAQLQRACRMVAEGVVPSSLPFLRAEGMRLFLLWRETTVEVARERSEREERACLLAALRKRTIQVLVRIALSSDPIT
jgi:hypothetical protein